jgi:ParB-like nuclease domain
MSPARIKVADLVFDPDLYPRQHVDTQRIASLIRAIEGGSKLPPIVVCRSTRKIVDGVHRHQVALRTEQPTIAVEFRDYANDAERYKDAVLLNSAHGLPFREVDKLRIIAVGESLGLKEIDLAGMLRTSLTHVQALKPRYATVDKSLTAAGGNSAERLGAPFGGQDNLARASQRSEFGAGLQLHAGGPAVGGRHPA